MAKFPTWRRRFRRTSFSKLKRFSTFNTSSSSQSSAFSNQSADGSITEGDLSLRRSSTVDFSRLCKYSVVNGKTAIVIDGANGPALGIANALAENGAQVAILDLNDEAGVKAEDRANELGQCIRFFKCDSSSWESQHECFKEVLEWSGGMLDIVVTSPGIVTNNLLMSILPKHSEIGEPPKPPTKTLAVDLMGVYFTTSLALFYFNQIHSNRTSYEGFQPQLLFICSMAGYDGLHFGTDYAAAKHGVRAIWKTTRKPRPGMARYQSNLLAPTYVRENKQYKDENKAKNHNSATKDIADVVAGAMKCITDPTVEGRAICCCQGGPGRPGDMNFDLEDDLVDYNGGKALREHAEDLWLPSRATLSEDSNCAMQ